MNEKGEGRWRLSLIKISRFRGVADEQTYAFDGRSGLLHGDNGVGKSTVALALQWILYGTFPGGVLQKNQYNSFLVPVGQKNGAYSGEVVFARGEEKLVIRRAAQGRLVLETGEKNLEGAPAEQRRDTLLGLDMDTFVRAVLLQQSRIRGLLLDEPKDRNKAIDRLLGLDVVEHLVEVVRPNDFKKAAESRRAELDLEKREEAAREKLLTEQLEKARETARTLGFQKKDLNPSGLETRYAEIGKDLQALGAKYQVYIETLPPCCGVKDVPVAEKVFAKGLMAIRLDSELKKRSAPVEVRIAAITSLRAIWQSALKARDEAQAKRAGLVGMHGDPKNLMAERNAAEGRELELRRQLKAANALRQLLVDAGELVEAGNPNSCPVCEQELPSKLALSERLRQRIDQLASNEMNALQVNQQSVKARMVEIDTALEALASAEKDISGTQRELVGVCERVVLALGGTGIAENKVLVRMDEALLRDETERENLVGALTVMEEDLGALGLREGAIRTGLVPVIAKREEIGAFERDARGSKERHAKDDAAESDLEQLAARLDAIRKALLDTKQEVATTLLEKAGPRAQELFRRLIKQPVFNTLEVKANAKAPKVDYTFSVCSNGASATEREARLVLSDGQLTATALALFFALAESTAHDLDLLYVDDPTQNLDQPSKEAMAKVVAEIAARRQVIVATQDEDFVSLLKSEGFPAAAVVHHLKRWDGNPTVETQVPR